MSLKIKIACLDATLRLLLPDAPQAKRLLNAKAKFQEAMRLWMLPGQQAAAMRAEAEGDHLLDVET